MIHLTPPPNFNPRFEIVGAYIVCDGKMLLIQRGVNEPQAGSWAQPAGKMEVGETPHQAMQRELAEEIGMAVELADLTLAATIYVRFEEYDLIYHAFRLDCLSLPELTLNDQETQSHRWTTPQQALLMDLIHDNEPVIKLLFNLE